MQRKNFLSEMNLNILADVARRTNDFVVITDAYGYIEWVNEAFVKRTGYAVAEVIGKQPHEILHGELTDPLVAEFMRQKVQASESFEAEVLNYTKHGEPYWIEIEVKPIFDEQERITHFLAIESEITKYKQAQLQMQEYAQMLEEKNHILEKFADEQALVQRKLQQSELRYRHVVDCQAEMVCHYLPDTTLTFVNPAYATYFAQPIETLQGMKWLDLLPVDEHESVLAHIEDLIRTKERYTYEHQVLAPDGRLRWQQWTDVAIIDPVTSRLEIQAVGRDITHLKKEEEALQHALEKERHLNELKSEFVSMTSHEFRTPLTTILSTASFLEIAIDVLPKEKMLKRLQKIQTAVHHMNSLLDNVLLYGKMNSHLLLYQPQPTHLADFVRQTIEELQALTTSHTIIFTTNCQECIFQIDERLMYHILTNLLNNAIKYSPPATQVVCDLSCTETHFTLTVQDYGIGIPDMADPEAIFEAFRRGHNTVGVMGTGLGLSIVKQSVEKHGGQVEYVSQLNEGTTVIVTIPKERPDEKDFDH